MIDVKTQTGPSKVDSQVRIIGVLFSVIIACGVTLVISLFSTKAVAVAAGGFVLLFTIILEFKLSYFIVKRYFVKNTKAYKSQNLRLLNLVDGLSLQLGVTPRFVGEFRDPAINIAALAYKNSLEIYVTTGALEKLSRIELEAIVAHGFAKYQLKEAKAATGSLGVLRLVTLFIPGFYKSDAFLPTERGTYMADKKAAEITKYPPALIDALMNAKENYRINNEKFFEFTKRLFMVPDDTGAFGIDMRVDLLSDL
jgi:hypothetical protein